jgi:hypothetical protein
MKHSLRFGREGEEEGKVVESFSSLLFQLKVPDPDNPLECSTLHEMMRSSAYEALKKTTGQDFGRDADAWEKWGRETGLLTSDLPKWRKD